MNFKKLSFLLPVVLCAPLMSSCSDDDNNGLDEDLSAKETTLKAAAVEYVNYTVLPTYKGMADNAVELFKNCETISENHAAGTLESSDIQKAADSWKEARRYWELSEAFLYGPAADYYIDPHIDSWPLDKNAMDRLLTEIRNGAEYTIDNNLGYGLLGFHSLEYMLFVLTDNDNDSQLHSLNYTPEEIKYLLLVAEDLRNQCVYLESCWAGVDNVSAEKQEILEEAELGNNRVYGDMMKNAGLAGSIYKTYQEVAEEIIQGCIDIADEVGNTKIGRPNTGSNEEDRNYIESPYSLNSIEDFQDNIRSIQNAYCGSRANAASISDYIKSINPALDTEVKTAIENSINAIKAIPEPFAKNATGAQADNAVKVVGTDLVNTLNKAYDALSK